MTRRFTVALLLAALWGLASLPPALAKDPAITPLQAGDVEDFASKWTGSIYYPSQWGPAGWPGVIDEELREASEAFRGKWGFAERAAYPDSVEHIRGSYQRYMPILALANARTLVKNFRATEITGIDARRVADYAEPVYWVSKYGVGYKKGANVPQTQREAFKTSKYNKPVQVLKWDQSHPAMELDLGELEPSIYALRIIAATETEHVQYSTKRLVINCEINDGPAGEVHQYRKRCAALDEFYPAGTFFFTAVTRRSYKVKLWIDPSSQMPLLVYNIDLHDRLGMCAQTAGKKTASFYVEAERAAKWQEKGTARKDERSVQERLEADQQVWERRPEINAQPASSGNNPAFNAIANSALDLLPKDAKDDGMGVDFYGSDMLWNRDPKEINEDNWTHWRALEVGRRENLQRQTAYPAGNAVGARIRGARGSVLLNAKKYDETGDEIAARTAAVQLAIVGWINLAGVHTAHEAMDIIDVIPNLDWLRADNAFRSRMREAFAFQHYCIAGSVAYDQIFPYIRGNEELAQSLGRFLPQIKNAADLVRFYDTALLQFPAQLVMTYEDQSGSDAGQALAYLIAVQQEPKIADFWVQWMFRYLWMYPLYPAGVDELMVNAVTRDGTDRRGSVFYTHAGTFLTKTLECFQLYKKFGGKLVRDLPAPEANPKAAVGPRFASDMMVAGGYTFWIGDVSGPTRPRELEIDPRNVSRVLSNWCGVLESNVPAEDFTQRRAAGLRVGWGMGHAHHDQLDLQIWAQGLPMCGDGGGRSGYGVPSTQAVIAHNTVADSSLSQQNSHSWISAIADTEGARYLEGRLLAPGIFARQIALVDAAGPGNNSYVVDVFRVQGGSEAPMYCFHGPPNDQLDTNARDVQKGAPINTLDPETAWNGQVPDNFMATWQMRREGTILKWVNPQGKPMKLQVPAAEAMAVGKLFDANSPRKFIRMHMLGHQGDEAFGIRMFCLQGNTYSNDIVYVRPQPWSGSTIFPVVYEPYSGERFVQSVKLLTPEAPRDAAAATAIEVQLVGGQRDVIYMAPRDSGPTMLAGIGTFHGEYAYLSYDRTGLRQATLVGGMTLEAEGLAIASELPAYTGTVSSIDYNGKSVVLSGLLPQDSAGVVIETGPKARPTSYTIEKIAGHDVVFTKGFDQALLRVVGFLPDGQPIMQDRVYGVMVGQLATKDDGKTAWRIGPEIVRGEKSELTAALGGYSHPVDLKPWEKAVALVDGPDPKQTLRPGDSVFIWELGQGDAYRLATHVNLRRGDDGQYQATGNGNAVIKVGDKELRTTAKLQ